MAETGVTSVAVGAAPASVAERLAALHAAELPQKDFLCGCFWGALALRAFGVDEVGGEPASQDLVARAAGTTVPDADRASVVPPGEASRRDYERPLPRAPLEAAGTSASALARVLVRLGTGRLAVVPVAGPWSPRAVSAVMDVAGAARHGAVVLANLRTGPLWGSRPEPGVVLAYLAGGHVAPPPADWDVGHFVNLAGHVRDASAGRALVVVRDSYRSLGWEGHHVQPPDALADALERGDGAAGGVLCVCPPPVEASLRQRLGGAGLDLALWDNGTPDPG